MSRPLCLKSCTALPLRAFARPPSKCAPPDISRGSKRQHDQPRHHASIRPVVHCLASLRRANVDPKGSALTATTVQKRRQPSHNCPRQPTSAQRGQGEQQSVALPRLFARATCLLCSTCTAVSWPRTAQHLIAGRCCQRGPNRAAGRQAARSRRHVMPVIVHKVLSLAQGLTFHSAYLEATHSSHWRRDPSKLIRGQWETDPLFCNTKHPFINTNTPT